MGTRAACATVPAIHRFVACRYLGLQGASITYPGYGGVAGAKAFIARRTTTEESFPAEYSSTGFSN